ncbi:MULTISPECIES: BrnA antitoxin family protein [unclassified Bartonella]|uniref:BrnA antitoxin family protein n=1 Tax=unclassified Bartonella TaxID=2645622 RepID=UPI0035D07134
MKKKVRYKIDVGNLSPLTDKQRVEVDKLAAMPDSAIDHSDIPSLNDVFWKNAVRNPFYKPPKTVTTVRVDSDVLARDFKSQGKGYQKRINAILRDAMLRSMH